MLLVGVLYGQSAEALHTKLNKAYSGFDSFQASVKQTNYYAQLKKSVVYSGNIWFMPGRMVMRFDKPSLQRLQISGGQVQLYDASSETLFKSSMLPEFGKMNPVEIFQHYWKRSTVKILSSQKGISVVSLVPHKDPMIKELTASINEKTGIISQLSYTDASGNKVSYAFSGVKVNQIIPASVWSYNYPKNVKVVEQ
jgi:outer membrane lipoprotein-sorting protein